MQKLFYPFLFLSIFLFSCQNSQKEVIHVDPSEFDGSKPQTNASGDRLEAEELMMSRPKLDLNAAQSAISQRNNEFAIEFFRQMNEGNSDNLLYSPLSISLALGMTYAGANGKTAEQMADVLNYKENSLDFHQEFNELTNKLTTPYGEGTEITIANRIYLQQGKELKATFSEILDQAYQAPIQEVDFSQTEAVKKTINSWVSEQTKGNIPKLIDKIPQNSKMALVNAIYFYGSWATSFEKELTASNDFYLADGSTQPTDFMQHDFKANDMLGPEYTETKEYQALALPYKGGKASMMILLPKEGISADQLLGSFNATSLQECRENMKGDRPELHLELPKWKLEATAPAMEILKKMGMTNAFQSGIADFSGMDGSLDLYISKIVHKATIEVNEEGTEATAATVVIMSGRGVGGGGQPVSFIANRPFLYFILDNDSNSILFMGKYEKPEATIQ
jgi:serpin B